MSFPQSMAPHLLSFPPTSLPQKNSLCCGAALKNVRKQLPFNYLGENTNFKSQTQLYQYQGGKKTKPKLNTHRIRTPFPLCFQSQPSSNRRASATCAANGWVAWGLWPSRTSVHPLQTWQRDWGDLVRWWWIQMQAGKCSPPPSLSRVGTAAPDGQRFHTCGATGGRQCSHRQQPASAWTQRWHFYILMHTSPTWKNKV